ncbi:hypothetical protein WJX81_002532 [Elliptochloris bilobata]|uniref:Phospholipase/carboxylesterase/thioesterase domain-containing protein n=1 Tax=Elliptochloris bilobata TaxID=381761 RepID=A0AAW1QXK4_9CHLO
MAIKPGFPPTVVNPTGNAAVIFLHGLGDTGRNLSMLASAFRLPHVKFVFPTAPTRRVTINMGASMPAWFDLYDVQSIATGRNDKQGIAEATTYLGQLVEEEIKAGIPAERIAVGGFSQGGHVALKYSLTAQRAPAACVALSTWLEPDTQTASTANLATKYFLGHGTADPLIPCFLLETTKSALASKGVKDVDLRTYQGVQHSTSMEELDDVRDFLLRALSDAPPPTREEVERMSVRELKALLTSRGVDTHSFLERSEFVERAKALL